MHKAIKNGAEISKWLFSHALSRCTLELNNSIPPKCTMELLERLAAWMNPKPIQKIVQTTTAIHRPKTMHICSIFLHMCDCELEIGMKALFLTHVITVRISATFSRCDALYCTSRSFMRFCWLLPFLATPAHFNSNYDPVHVINTSNRLYCVIR